MSVPPDDLRQVPVEDYLRAHAVPNGHGVKGFIKSPLFAGLTIFILTQAVLVGGVFVTIYWKVNTFTEWKGEVNRDLETFKNQGSPALRKDMESNIKNHAEKLGALDARVKAVEEDTKHLDVMEAEFRRITTDVEKLKNNGKK